ncbi:MAG: FHA domain-containing protein [Anaerotardibacter sp.]
MIDIILLIGRLLFVALLYVFLFAIMKTGIGLVRGQRKKEKNWTVTVEKGPKELRGVNITVTGPVVIGRNPNADITIRGDYVSSQHARFVLMGQNLFIEDMGSTNGTLVNDVYIQAPLALKSGDKVTIGGVTMRVRFA